MIPIIRGTAGMTDTAQCKHAAMSGREILNGSEQGFHTHIYILADHADNKHDINCLIISCLPRNNNLTNGVNRLSIQKKMATKGTAAIVHTTLMFKSSIYQHTL